MPARFDVAAHHHHEPGGAVRQHDYAGVLPLLRQASELAPDNARYAYFHAIALNAAGAPAQAMALLEQAHRRHPTDTDLLVALVSLARDGSDPRTALRYARELAALRPADPRIRALVLDLEEHR